MSDSGWKTGPAAASDSKRDERGRFRKGASGNPNGRPIKHRRAATIQQLSDDILNASARLVIDSVTGRKVTRQEAIINRFMDDAVNAPDYPARYRAFAMLRDVMIGNDTLPAAEFLKQNERDLRRIDGGKDPQQVERIVNAMKRKTWPEHRNEEFPYVPTTPKRK